jgi:hypothetical protein
MIEQVQHVLCKFRQSDYPFGGVQMIWCGNFLVTSHSKPNYNNDGYYCVQSTFVRNCFHQVLSTIHRQSEPDFIAAIHQIAG